MEEEMNLGNCPDCKSPLTIKRGRYGIFIGCSGYPKCKHIQKIERSSGIKCEACKEGELVEKHTRKGKMFWGCNKYPECTNAQWTDPKTTPQSGKVTIVKAASKKAVKSKKKKGGMKKLG